MLRVTVEIWPGGDKTRARAVAIANVANLSDLADVSDYAVSVTEGQSPVSNTPPWSQRGYVFQHDRRTSVWALVAKVAIWAAEEAGKTGDDQARGGAEPPVETGGHHRQIA